MACRIEDYALLGDCRSAALVGLDGSIDWLCLPRFDADACFAALLGTQENGFWRIAPAGELRSARRSYRDGTLTLDTELTSDEGTIVITDFMPVGDDGPGLIRIVTGMSGAVRIRSELVLRFNVGKTVPWVQRHPGGIRAVAGPDLVRLWTPAPVRGENLHTFSEAILRPGERLPFVLRWGPSHLEPPPVNDPEDALARCEAFWRKWGARCTSTASYGARCSR